MTLREALKALRRLMREAAAAHDYLTERGIPPGSLRGRIRALEARKAKGG